MREVYGDAWELAKDFDVLCITTNGALNRYGECVMGRGIAAQFKRKYPFAPKILGNKIKENGNVLQAIMWNEEIAYYAFPVKRIWNENASITLIKESAFSLANLANQNKDKKYLLPRPGCGNGHLRWEDVKYELASILPNNVYIVHFRED